MANLLCYNDLMTITVNIHEAKTQLSRRIQRALSGEEVVIARDGQPVARLIPITLAGESRPAPGIDAGKVTISPDFDAPLEEFENL
jgi:antitoxin (DNA-binding transcriptional repressor) of toxin-antitoxin stability system